MSTMLLWPLTVALRWSPLTAWELWATLSQLTKTYVFALYLSLVVVWFGAVYLTRQLIAESQHKIRKRRKRRVKADRLKDGRGRGQRGLKRLAAVVLSAGAHRRSGRGTKRQAKVVVSAKPRERTHRQESCGLACTSVQGRESSGQRLTVGLREGSAGVDKSKPTGL